jgi:hypothetical protein
MVFQNSKAALLASLFVLLCPSVMSLTVPPIDAPVPEVPWKYAKRGIHSPHTGRQYDTGACQNGPESRSCWGDYNIDTDSYKYWPSTGNTVKVR